MEKRTEIFVYLQKKWIDLHGIKNGDTVKVIRTFSEGECGCESSFYDEPQHVGKIFKIDDTLKGNMQIGINLDNGPIMPYFCLEPVKEEKKEVFYKRGDRFVSSESSTKGTYLLSSASRNSNDPYLALVCVDGVDVGNILHYAVKVEDIFKVTENELKKMCNGHHSDLKLL